MSLEIVKRYFAALKTRSAETIGETFHDDIDIWGPLGETRGKAEAVEHFAGLYDKLPDTTFTMLASLSDGTNRAAVEWEWRATGPKGPLRIVGVDWMEFADGKIRVLKFYYDPAALRG